MLKYMRGDNMTSPQIMKYWRKNIKNKYLILFELGKIRVFQNLTKSNLKTGEIPNSLRGSLSCLGFRGSRDKMQIKYDMHG